MHQMIDNLGFVTTATEPVEVRIGFGSLGNKVSYPLYDCLLLVGGWVSYTANKIRSRTMKTGWKVDRHNRFLRPQSAHNGRDIVELIIVKYL